ncbi:SurA N-terminal domain-containing protein [Anaerobacillus sp. MEB173]|uniref:SurA N-terminal domain-containing protein n=1 Tax=Anaerobacillus sp. MEB173 TaxID=3383345 RepID=UPI003F8FAA19
MFRTTLYVLLVTVMFTLLAACGGQEQVQEEEIEGENQEYVAIVNDQEIPRAEYEELILQQQTMYAENGFDVTEDEEMMQVIEDQVLEELISQALIEQAFVERNIEVSDEKVQEELALIKSEFEDETQFEETLLASNLTVEELKELIAQQVKLEQLIASEIGEITVTEEEIETLFNQYVENFEDEELNYEEVKPLIEQQLMDEKRNEHTLQLIDNLKQDANIELFV